MSSNIGVFQAIVSNWISTIEFDAIRKANEIAKHEALLGRKRVQSARTRKIEKKAAKLEVLMTEEGDDEL